MDGLTIAIIISAILSAVLGLLVFLSNPRKKDHQVFGFFSFLVVVWNISNILPLWDANIIYIKAAYAIGAVISPTIIFWLSLICERKIGKKTLLIMMGFGIFFFFASFIDGLIIGNVEKVVVGRYDGTPGSLLYLYGIYFLANIFIILFRTFDSYFKGQGAVKKQMGYLLIGFLFWGMITLLTSFILPIFGINKFMGLDAASSAIFLFFTALAITQYSLFEIKVILTEFLVAVMGLVLLGLLFFMPTPALKIAVSVVFLFYCLIAWLLIESTLAEIKAKESLEQKVQERTKELQNAYEDIKSQKNELEKWYNLTIGRELRMAELKEKIKNFEQK
jgi:hypothetical protein